MIDPRVRHLLAPLAALFALAIAACEGQPTGASPQLEALPRQLSVSEQAVISSSNQFAFDLLRQVNDDDAAENVFISPLSVSMALGMTMNGAVGTTYDEMRSTLRFGDLEQAEINDAYRNLIDLLLGLDPSVGLGIANSVWAKEGYPFEQSFFDTVEASFDAELASLVFDQSALARINGWVDEATRGRIESILDEIRADAVMYLINAIYFKGTWRQQFDPDETHDAPFRTLDGGEASVRMMSGRADVRSGRGDGFTLVDIPYGNGAFSMTILLPDEGGNVNDLVAELGASEWEVAVAALAGPRESPIDLPKFTLEYEKVLNETLKALGMPTAFGSGADFSKLSALNGQSLEISEVRHKSFVQVNEEGTEAAAVTSVEIIETSAPVETRIRVDRPFVFAIREQFSGTILFMGKIVLPEE